MATRLLFALVLVSYVFLYLSFASNDIFRYADIVENNIPTDNIYFSAIKNLHRLSNINSVDFVFSLAFFNLYAFIFIIRKTFPNIKKIFYAYCLIGPGSYIFLNQIREGFAILLCFYLLANRKGIIQLAFGAASILTHYAGMILLAQQIIKKNKTPIFQSAIVAAFVLIAGYFLILEFFPDSSLNIYSNPDLSVDPTSFKNPIFAALVVYLMTCFMVCELDWFRKYVLITTIAAVGLYTFFRYNQILGHRAIEIAYLLYLIDIYRQGPFLKYRIANYGASTIVAIYFTWNTSVEIFLNAAL